MRYERSGYWAGDRKQTTLWTIPTTGGQDAETIHANPKPVECMRRPMLNNSSPRSCGRVCFGIKIDPLFVDVAIACSL